jgi:hypothetical protein
MFHIVILSFFLISCASFNSKVTNTTINNYKTATITFNFDPLVDYPIDKSDPRIKSIIYSINHNKNTSLTITYCNNRTKFMAKNYQKILKNYYHNKIIIINKASAHKCKLLEVIITRKL